ncbi:MULTISPECIES: CitMHS family transporter [Pectobacterium]|uniref:CitMHS family transporter n=1 Tax=Pectobacterium TaxID=122277 RepID=UPI001CD4D851|nr:MULTISPECIES: citrate:proton symporter [Pectobacterium]UXK01799.1 citrate:proton symporter [Pectobacterium aroidearum]GKV94988.1 citrate transporter [Pectobacterium carotovorum subsp. carotovorum]
MTIISYLMIAVFMLLIMTRRLSALLALILVPLIFAIIAGFHAELGKMMMDGIKLLAPTGVMLTFAILYFSVMTDAGLFDPFIKIIIRIVKGDPLKVILGTAILGISVALDGDGATTYLICTTALLPLYRRLGIKIQYMATVLLLSVGVMNMIPWGGPTARAASAMKVDLGELFMYLMPIMLFGLAWVISVSIIFGLRERRRLGTVTLEISENTEQRATIRECRYIINSLLTIVLLAMLILGVLPMAALFMIAFALAMLINFPDIKKQQELIAKHADNVLAIVSLIFAAGIFTGILSGTGMVDAISNSLITSLPPQAGPWLGVITALLSMPFTFFMTNDAFYFGVLPILAQTAVNYGITPMQMAIASLIGQPVHLLSPLVASTYLLVGILNLDYGLNQRASLKWAIGTVLCMLAGAILLGILPLEGGATQ